MLSEEPVVIFLMQVTVCLLNSHAFPDDNLI